MSKDAKDSKGEGTIELSLDGPAGDPSFRAVTSPGLVLNYHTRVQIGGERHMLVGGKAHRFDVPAGTHFFRVSFVPNGALKSLDFLELGVKWIDVSVSAGETVHLQYQAHWGWTLGRAELTQR